MRLDSITRPSRLHSLYLQVVRGIGHRINTYIIDQARTRPAERLGGKKSLILSKHKTLRGGLGVNYSEWFVLNMKRFCLSWVSFNAEIRWLGTARTVKLLYELRTLLSRPNSVPPESWYHEASHISPETATRFSSG